MSWATEGSKVFRRYIANMVADLPATPADFDTHTVKAALYNNTCAPDNDVTSDVLMGYNGTGSQWVTANEVTGGAGQWDAGGVALTSKSIDVATADYVMIDAADTASGSAANITDAYGCLVYDDGMTDKCGFCFNYFGGANSVTNGTFTIVWHANGIFRFAL